MVNYSNGNIYKLCCLDPNITEIYIGSTVNKYRRKQQHKKSCYNKNCKAYNYYVYSFIRANGNFENWDFVEIEQYNATDKADLHKREKFWVDELKSELNCKIPTRKHKEWRQDNKYNISEQKKQYCEENKDKLKENTKQYREQNKHTYDSEYYKQYRKQRKLKLQIANETVLL